MPRKRAAAGKPFNTWKPADEEKLRKAVRNFNDKIRRLEKDPKYQKDKAALPEKITVTQLKEAINSRQDLNREIKSLKRFSKRGAEKVVKVPGSDYNLKITEWQKKDMQYRLSAINRKRNERRKMISEIEMTQRGELLGYKKGEIGVGRKRKRKYGVAMESPEDIQLTPMQSFTRKMSYQDLDYKYRNMRLESSNKFWDESDQRHKDNYIKALKKHFNEEDIKPIIESINTMDYRKFRKIFEAEGGNFELAYPDEEQYDAFINELEGIWLEDLDSI